MFCPQHPNSPLKRNFSNAIVHLTVFTLMGWMPHISKFTYKSVHSSKFITFLMFHRENLSDPPNHLFSCSESHYVSWTQRLADTIFLCNVAIKKCNQQTSCEVCEWVNHACVTTWYSTIFIVGLVLKHLCADLTLILTKLTLNCTHWVIFSFLCWAE